MRARAVLFNREIPRATRSSRSCSRGSAPTILTLNMDGTQNIQVRRQEMLDFLPEVIPAIQEATATPIAFDNPSVDYHRVALEALRPQEERRADSEFARGLARTSRRNGRSW